MVLYLTRDLMFSSRVRPVVASFGLRLKIVATAADAQRHLEQLAATPLPTTVKATDQSLNHVDGAAKDLSYAHPDPTIQGPSLEEVDGAVKGSPDDQRGPTKQGQSLKEVDGAVENCPEYLYLVVDLKAIGQPEELNQLIQASCNLGQGWQVKSLAYGPHVNVPLLEAARNSGCQAVMTQGQFDREFGAWLQRSSAAG